jgi:hypothetical protein
MREAREFGRHHAGEHHLTAASHQMQPRTAIILLGDLNRPYGFATDRPDAAPLIEIRDDAGLQVVDRRRDLHLPSADQIAHNRA